MILIHLKENQNQNEENEAPVRHKDAKWTRISPAGTYRPQIPKETLWHGLFHFYTGEIKTQVPPPKVRASDLNEKRMATLRWGRMVNTIKTGNFGAMTLEISKNIDIVNDTLEEIYPGIISAK
jgi:hypothetical protein